jgi:hypothetical protein
MKKSDFIDFQIDHNGDLDPYALSLSSGPDGVASWLEKKTTMILGEFFLDRDQGVDWGFGQRSNEKRARASLLKAILRCPAVSSVNFLSLSPGTDRVLRAKFSANLLWGDTVAVA